MNILKKLLLTLIMVFIIAGSASAKVVVAIDAGHGGKDSGAVGPNKLYEKNVTLAVAKKLLALLNKDSTFSGVLTRSNDSFISVSSRSDIARTHKANLLISIHADAAPNRSATGASVWVLSTLRADTELGSWLEQHEKQSELLGGAGDALSSGEDPFLSQAILDLQFGHSQAVGYKLAQSIIEQMNRTKIAIHRGVPEHASLGVLRSPDIPSVLVEIGFISNSDEEKLLRTNTHQNKIAEAIYQGIKEYIKKNPIAEAKS